MENKKKKVLKEKDFAKLEKNKRKLKIKLGIKTKALWVASGIIHKRLAPKKSVKEIYETLKFVGKNHYLHDNPQFKTLADKFCPDIEKKP